MSRSRDRSAEPGSSRPATVILAGIVLLAAVVFASNTQPSFTAGNGKERRVEGPVPEHVLAIEQAGGIDPVRVTANPDALPSTEAHKPGTRPKHRALEDERIFGTSGDDWEPAIAVDPSDPNRVYQMVTRFGGTAACPTCPDPAMILKRSVDGGATWLADQYICNCPGTTDQDDPILQVGDDGTVYALWMESYVPGVSFAKSTDHGATWTAPVAIDGGGGASWYSDKPWLTISPNGQDIYINISAGTTNGDNYVVTSHNGGASFLPRVKVNPTATLYWYPEGGAVAPNGDVYLAQSADQNASPFDSTIQVTRSTNGGTSWTSQQIDTSFEGAACGGGCPSFFLNAQSSLDIDPNGKIMIVYVSNSADKAAKTLYFRTSTDGTTWSSRTAINTAGDSNFPQVVAAGVDDFRVAWQDNATSGRWNTRYRKTTDGGVTWRNMKTASNLGSGAAYKNASGYSFPYGDYFDMDVDPFGKPFLIWGEGVSYTGAGDVWYTRGT